MAHVRQEIAKTMAMANFKPYAPLQTKLSVNKKEILL